MADEEISEEALAEMERRVREGLGPEQFLVDHLLVGEGLQQLLNLPAGKALIAESTLGALTYLRMLADETPPSPEEERKALLALRLNIGILRRMVLIVKQANTAAETMISDDIERGLPDQG